MKERVERCKEHGDPVVSVRLLASHRAVLFARLVTSTRVDQIIDYADD